MRSRRPCVVDELDRRERHQPGLDAEVEEAAAAARRRATRGTSASAGQARPPAHGRERGASARGARCRRGAASAVSAHGDDRPGQQRELGDEADAPRAQQTQRDGGQQLAPADAAGRRQPLAATPAARKKNGPSSGQRAVRYSSSGRSQGMRKWLAM